ncbi:hypothetical protein FNV43_RR04247 [Rhamnella rubrinervis]|uniref:Uncharacterized protein n=1 Tax=Rhamnella rubrinervis TaxID=2594499 RepID=A0A8K0HJV6_9ROSA|nr:hypothetical protein FNV43_RR04247 [Rhamnella rubrinervis]
MAPTKRLVKASEKQVSSKQSIIDQKQKTRQATAKESQESMKRVVLETPILLPVKKNRRGNVEEQAPISTTTNIAPEQSQPVQILECKQWYIGPNLCPTAASAFYHTRQPRRTAHLQTKFFGKRGPITQGEFSKAFEDLDFDENEVADNVKCCMFYFLETVLLGGDKKRLIWGFETIPTVATIGPRGKYHGSSWIPRILTWSCPSILQYIKLATLVFDRKDYTVKNKLHPTKEELQQTYMRTFWHRRSDRKYYGPSVFRVEASQSQSQPAMLPSITFKGRKDASQSEFHHTSRLEMQIEEMRSELVNIRTEMREKIRQQRKKIQNLSSLVRQLVNHFAPTPLSAVPAEPTESTKPVVPVWDPFTPIDPAERAVLSAFTDDPSTTVHPGDYDAIEKSLFEAILASGAWLGDLEVDAALYYIRRRIINSPQMYDQRAI